MITETFNIKGMICTRCLKVLNNELRTSGAEVVNIQLGKVTIKYQPDKLEKTAITKIILDNDFEIIEGNDVLLAEQTKRWVINYVWNTDLEKNISEYLSANLEERYIQISRNFSKVFDQTIERYCLLLKIEKAKEAIEVDGVSFKEVAHMLGYQNSSALAKQFKKETGITMKQFRIQSDISRIPLDKI